MALGELPSYSPARIFSGSGPERDRELFLACRDVVQVLHEHYARPECPQPMAAIRGVSLGELRQLVHENPSFGRLFGSFRDLVLRHEEQCARRLECLRSTICALLELRPRASVVDALDGMLESLGDFCAREWNLDPPLDRRERDWALNAARRYDLLPPSLRRL